MKDLIRMTLTDLEAERLRIVDCLPCVKDTLSQMLLIGALKRVSYEIDLRHRAVGEVFN